MTDMDIYAPDEEGRTEKATPGKIKKARKEGRVARSSELTAVVSVLAALLFMIFWGRHMVTELKMLLGQCVELAAEDEGSYARLAAAALGTFCKAVLPLLLVVFAAALVAELEKAAAAGCDTAKEVLAKKDYLPKKPAAPLGPPAAAA